MDSILVLPLTAEAHDYFWLPNEVDGAVGPGGSYSSSHLEYVIHVFHTHRNTFHQPLHSGCGDPIKGAVALHCLLQGTREIERCGRYCGEGGSEVRKAP